jgi:predicted RNA-binding protein with PIN domain
MSESIKATRATVAIGDLTVDAFMLPDGSYRMSQTQLAEAVGKDEINARRFLTSKNINAIRGESYTPDSIEVSSPNEIRGQN